ncbi:MAG TPA: hypothetical protein VFG69_12105 [Nannocystaceae bacterium]|nr:hypothetical protein [Nannocystaceae bacterium]
MLRLSLAVLLVCVACGKDVDDPSFDNSATAAGSSGGSSSSGGGGSEGTVSASSNPTTADSADGNSADDGAETGGMATTGPASSTGAAGSEGGNGTCGDGAISPGEQCDGADLQNFDCMSLGLSGGTLSCDPMTCTFDTSMCMSMGSTSGW